LITGAIILIIGMALGYAIKHKEVGFLEKEYDELKANFMVLSEIEKEREKTTNSGGWYDN